MTQTEQNYAQIQRGLLVFACEKFDHYIFGRSNVVVQLDQKPLETIVKKTIHNSPKCLQCFLLCLQNCDIHVEYKKGATKFLADPCQAYLENKPVGPIQDSDISLPEKDFFLFS